MLKPAEIYTHTHTHTHTRIKRCLAFLFSAFLFISPAFSATLPSGYTELEYIENHGNNYIDTGIVPHNSVLKIDLDFQITEVDDNNNVVLVATGSNQGVVGGGIRIGVKNNTSVTPNAYYFYNIETGSNWNMFAPMTTSRNKILWTIDGTVGTSIITGDLSDSITSTSHFGNNKAWRNDSVQLLNGRNVAGDFYKNVTKLYKAKIYLDDVLVFDGVPAKRNSDNKVGLYDTVSNAFFEPVNSALGEKTYTQLEYIDIPANTAFNTNVYLDGTMDIEYETMIVHRVATGQFGGARSEKSYGAGFNFPVNYNNSGATNILVDFFGSQNSNGRWTIQRNSSTYTPEENKKYKLSIINKVGTFAIDGTVVDTHTYLADGISNTVPYVIHGSYNVDTLYYGYEDTIRFYHFSATGVADIVPVKRDCDNVLGLYNKTTGEFLQKIGSGTLVAGPATSTTISKSDIYTQLEYVTTNHDAYIQTNLNVNDFDKVTAKASLVDNSGNIAYALFGSRMYLNNNETGKAFYFKTSWVSIPYATAIYGTSWMHSWNNFVSTEIPLNQMVNYDIKLADGDQLVKVNSTTIGQNTLSYGGIDIPYLVPLFAHNYNGAISNIPYLDCAGMTFYLGDTVVANFIPARRNSDNVAGMYDTISDMFYPSTNNANFTSGPVLGVVAGPEVLTCGYTELEYLELQGEAYFNTNVYLSKDMDIEFEFMPTQLSVAGTVIGVRAVNTPGSGFNLFYNINQPNNATNTLIDFFGVDNSTGRWAIKSDGLDYVLVNNKKYKLSIVNKVGTFSADGVVIDTHTYTAPGTSPITIPFYIHTCNNAGNVGGTNDTIRFYHFSATGVADIVPVKRDCDNVLGLYNKTTGEFLEKIGSGTLVAGPEIAAPATITIHWGDLSEPEASGMCVYGETFTAPSVIPTAAAGYKFLGWRPI